MTKRTGSLRFEVDARHIGQLGRQLVADRVTALSELIKNAYDADATEVEVVFGQDAGKPGGTLEIRDNGHGMTLSDVSEKWMRISTDYKESNSVSPHYQRNRAGRKGIGRFAVESLGERLVMRSSVEGSGERVIVTFNWDEYYAAGTNLEAIDNFYRVEPANEDEHGTSLRIEGLHDGWTNEAVQRVQRAVLLLQPPFPTDRIVEVSSDQCESRLDPGFNVRVIWEGREGLPDDSGLRNFLDAATATISGWVDEQGIGTWRIHSNRLGLDDQQVTSEPVLSTGPFSFRAAYFVYASDAIGSVTLSIARQMSREYAGVRLYRDGLRIMPYGERGDDWLGLDGIYRRRPSTVLAPIGNINFFGQVFVSRADNVLLIDTASREGVIENDAFQELRTFVTDGLIWGVQRVAAARQKEKDSTEAPEPPTRTELVNRTLEAFGAARAALDTVKDASGTDGSRDLELVEQHLERAQEELRSAQQDAQQADREDQHNQERLLGEIELYRILASLGTSIAVFSHEVRAMLNGAEGALSDVEYEAQQAQMLNGHTIEQRIADAHDAMQQLNELSSFIDTYASHSSRRLRTPQPMVDVVDKFLAGYKKALDKRGVIVDSSIEPRYLRTAPMARSELMAILINFLTNSLKAIDVEGHSERRIAVVVRQENNEIVLRFQDSGTGIDESVRDRIFDAFFSTSDVEEDMLGFGTGLGLKIVQDIARANGGSVRIGTPDRGYATCFELKLPMWQPNANLLRGPKDERTRT